MSVTGDILATYRRPGPVMRRLIAAGQREDRALAMLMAACILVFVAQVPQLARQAHLAEPPLEMLLGASLLAWLMMAPLMLYGLAALSHLAARALGGRGDWYGARLALFWALLASSPVLLVHGLVAGLVGSGPARTGAGALWLAVFLWFWIAGLAQAERPAP